MPARTVLFLLVLAVCGCTSNLPRYPDAWSPLTDRCEPPAGTFSNRGELDSPSSYPLWTEGYLLPYFMDVNACESDCRIPGADRVSLEPEADGRVRVRAWQGAELHLELLLAGHCLDGRWELAGQWQAASGPDLASALFTGVITAGMVSGNFAIDQRRGVTRASDGSLVIHDRQTGVGLFLLVLPWRNDTARWARFPGVESPAGEPANR
jgi:hypothetical protein